MNVNAMHAIPYGLFVLTAQENGKDCGCIVNTLAQVTTSPNRVTITVNKQNYTHGVIQRTGFFNVSILTTSCDFSVFERFGFRSSADCDKFAGLEAVSRSENGLYYLTGPANAYVSGKVVSAVDLGTHTQFIADVTDAQVLSEEPSVTYAYYHQHIKPKPPKKTGYVCKICGYVYEGDVLPDDFICPLCKHGPQDFEKITIE